MVLKAIYAHKRLQRNTEERDGSEPQGRKCRKAQTFIQPDGLSKGSARAIRRQPRVREDYIDYSKDKAIAQEIFEDDPDLDDLLDQDFNKFHLSNTITGCQCRKTTRI